MKKCINQIEDAVIDQLKGIASAHSRVKVNFESNYIIQSGSPLNNDVGIISGGGSGHEPMHGGFGVSCMLQ